LQLEILTTLAIDVFQSVLTIPLLGTSLRILHVTISTNRKF